MTLKIIRISAWVLTFLIAAVMVGFLSDKLASKTVQKFPDLNTVAFTLPATNGKTISNKDLLGRPTAMFYGFTHCPDVCPTTLYGLDDIVQTIGVEAEPLQIVFVTVDPERDTMDVLGEYISAISDNAIGLSGTAADMADMRRGFGIFAERAPLDKGDYTMDHTATVYLYSKTGRLAGTIAWGEPNEFAIAKIRNLLTRD